MNGKIKRQGFQANRGFGFIQPDEGGKDIFLHISQFGEDVTFSSTLAGAAVEFEVEHSERGLCATNVRLVD